MASFTLPPSNAQTQCFFCLEISENCTKINLIDGSLAPECSDPQTQQLRLSFELLCHLLTLDLQSVDIKSLSSCTTCTFSLLKLHCLIGAHNNLKSQIGELLEGIQNEIFRSGTAILCDYEDESFERGEERLLRQEFIRCGEIRSLEGWTNRATKESIPAHLYHEVEALLPLPAEIVKDEPVAAPTPSNEPGFPFQFKVELDPEEFDHENQEPRTERLIRLLQRHRKRKFETDSGSNSNSNHWAKRRRNIANATRILSGRSLIETKMKLNNDNLGSLEERLKNHQTNPKNSAPFEYIANSSSIRPRGSKSPRPRTRTLHLPARAPRRSTRFTKGPNGELLCDGVEYLESETHWTCTLCNDLFSREKDPQNLWSHIIRIHTKNYKYPCPFCSDFAHMWPNRLRDHLLNAHNPEENPKVQAYLQTLVPKILKRTVKQRGMKQKVQGLERSKPVPAPMVLTSSISVKVADADSDSVPAPCPPLKSKPGRKPSGRFTEGPDGKLLCDGVEYLESETHWTCTLCNDSFSREKDPQNLWSHIIRIHTKNYKYPCPFCSDFAHMWPNRLRDHLLNAHNPEENPKVQAYLQTLVPKILKRTVKQRLMKQKVTGLEKTNSVQAPSVLTSSVSVKAADTDSDSVPAPCPPLKSKPGRRPSGRFTEGPDGKLLCDGVEYLESETHWICTLCNESFSREKNQQNLWSHIIRIHTKNYKYPCPFCSNFAHMWPNRLRDHLLNAHEPQKDPKVKACLESLLPQINKRTITKVSKKSQVPPAVSIKWKRKFIKKNGKLYYDGVEFLQSSTSFTCTICKAEFSQLECGRMSPRHKLYRHILEKHTGNVPFTCPFALEGCTSKYLWAHQLQDHLLRSPLHKNNPNTTEFVAKLTAKYGPLKFSKRKKKQKGIYICSTCGATYGHMKSLITHETREHGSEIFPCDICGKQIRGALSLKEHQKDVHVTKSDFKCPHCSRLLSTRSKLQTHIAQVHETDLRKWICPEPNCGKRFATRSSLQIHSSLHSNERNFFCEPCDMAFKNTTQLKKHRKGKRHLAKSSENNLRL